MSDSFISRKTCIEFRKYLASWTLQAIRDEFGAARIGCDQDYDPGLSGERKSLVERYYHSLDLSNPLDAHRLLVAFDGIISSAIERERRPEGVVGPFIATAIECLRRDGFEWKGGQLAPASARALQVFSATNDKDRISELTRRDIFDHIRVSNIAWAGRLSEVEFLDRIYDLDGLPSYDPRAQTAREDILTHRVSFPEDWPDDWVLSDARFALMSGSDEIFLAFISEMLHPAVRPCDEEARQMLSAFNGYLEADGWEIAERSQISGRPIFAARRLLADTRQGLAAAKGAAATLGSDHIHRQIIRMETAVHDDPELAIGTAKEFIEAVCKTILNARAVEHSNEDAPPRLVKLVLKALQLADDIPADDETAKAIRRMIGSLTGVAQGVTELRNLMGTGHGKSAWHRCAEPRHARLAVGAATALGVFLFEAYQEEEDDS